VRGIDFPAGNAGDHPAEDWVLGAKFGVKNQETGWLFCNSLALTSCSTKF
jgi:hypothetical protein